MAKFYNVLASLTVLAESIIFFMVIYNQHESDTHKRRDAPVITVGLGTMLNLSMEMNNSNEDHTANSADLVAEPNDMFCTYPSSVYLKYNHSSGNLISDAVVHPLKPGRGVVNVILSEYLSKTILKKAKFIIDTYKDVGIESASQIAGWFYLISWSSRFYSQISKNYRTGSVEGLSLEFLLFDMMGYVMYNVYNLGMVFFASAKEEFTRRNPGIMNPVKFQDVLLTAHAVPATTIIVYQYMAYKIGNKMPSSLTRNIILAQILTLIICCLLAIFNIVHWLDVLYMCAKLKIVDMFAKFIHQIYMNYKRRSINGLSMKGIAFELNGTLFCLLQIMADSENYGCLDVYIKHPTKLVVAVASMIFNSIFLGQYLFVIEAPENDIVMTERT